MTLSGPLLISQPFRIGYLNIPGTISGRLMSYHAAFPGIFRMESAIGCALLRQEDEGQDMMPVEGHWQFAQCSAPRGGGVDPAGHSFPERRVPSCLRSHPLSSRHSQVGQREQRVQLGGVLRQPDIARVHMAEAAFDHAQRMLGLGADACLDMLHLISDRIRRITGVERPAQPKPKHAVPARVDVLGAIWLFDALVVGIGEHVRFLTMHKRMRVGDVIDVGRGAEHRMHQAASSVDAEVTRHADVPLVAFPDPLRIGSVRARAAPPRTGRVNQRGGYRRAFLEHQPLGRQRRVHGLKHLRRQLVLLQQVPQAQDAHAIRQGRHFTQARKPAPVWIAEQRLFHSDVGQIELLLKKVNAQHDPGAEWRAASFNVVRVWLDQREPLRRRHYALHLVEELALVGSAASRSQPEGSLLQAFIVSGHAARRQGREGNF